MNYHSTVFNILGYCLCLDQSEVDEIKADWNLAPHELPPTDSQGRVDRIKVDKGTLCVVRINAPNVTYTQLLGLIVHECEHIKQYLFEEIGEESPSAEFEAYVVQEIATNLFDDYFTKIATKSSEIPKNASSFSELPSEI